MVVKYHKKFVQKTKFNDKNINLTYNFIGFVKLFFILKDSCEQNYIIKQFLRSKSTCFNIKYILQKNNILV